MRTYYERALAATLLFTQTFSIPTDLNHRELKVRTDPQTFDLLARDSPISFENKCDRKGDDKKLIEDEIYTAMQIAQYAQKHLKDDLGDYYRKNLVSKDLYEPTLGQLEDLYGRAAKVADNDKDKHYNLIVTCDDSTDKCKSTYIAHMRDNIKTMNLCNRWFKADDKGLDLRTSDDILKVCKDDKGPIKHLEDLWYGKAQAIVHEWTHTKFVFGGKEISRDYAYGVQNSLNLAAGSRKLPEGRDRKKDGTPLCPDKDDPTKPGFCDPNLSIDNADTLAIMAGGLFFSDKDRCDRDIKTDLKPKDKDEVLINPGFAQLPPGLNANGGLTLDEPVFGPEDTN